MRSLPSRRAAVAAVLLALPLTLAACSSGSPDKAVSSSTPTASSSSPTGGGARTGGGSSAESGKPSKQQVADGMTDYFVGKGVPRSLVEDVAACVADEGYPQFSDATLRALRDGRVNKLNPLDAGTLTKVTTDCLAHGKAGASLPSSVG
ncbi:hypothetical protein [Flexivirga lutea]